MGNITLVPVWIIQDVLVLIIATLMIFYIIDNEKRPKIVLMQFVCFVMPRSLKTLLYLWDLWGKKVFTHMGAVS